MSNQKSSALFNNLLKLFVINLHVLNEKDTNTHCWIQCTINYTNNKCLCILYWTIKHWLPWPHSMLFVSTISQVNNKQSWTTSSQWVSSTGSCITFLIFGWLQHGKPKYLPCGKTTQHRCLCWNHNVHSDSSQESWFNVCQPGTVTTPTYLSTKVTLCTEAYISLTPNSCHNSKKQALTSLDLLPHHL